jgi:hypothetical protein
MYSELFETTYYECNLKPLFEQILREGEETNALNILWLNIKNILKNNTKSLPIVEFNIQNYTEYLGGGKKPITTGYNDISVIMATSENGGFDLYKKLGTKNERGLTTGRTILLVGIKETLENPILVISDHDQSGRPATSYIRSYSYTKEYSSKRIFFRL